MRISDWSSDVCSSDLQARAVGADQAEHGLPALGAVVELDARDDAEVAQVARLGAPRRTDALERAGQRLGEPAFDRGDRRRLRSEEHTSELQSLMRISYAVFCLKKKTHKKITESIHYTSRNTNCFN